MSTNKTANYNLHAWEPGDDFLRSEFNDNFAAIDAAIRDLVVTGAYAGDGAETREIALGFRPRAVLLLSHHGTTAAGSNVYGGLALDGFPTYVNEKYPAILITDSGFQVSTLSSTYTNSDAYTFYYLALR